MEEFFLVEFLFKNNSCEWEGFFYLEQFLNACEERGDELGLQVTKFCAPGSEGRNEDLMGGADHPLRRVTQR